MFVAEEAFKDVVVGEMFSEKSNSCHSLVLNR